MQYRCTPWRELTLFWQYRHYSITLLYTLTNFLDVITYIVGNATSRSRKRTIVIAHQSRKKTSNFHRQVFLFRRYLIDLCFSLPGTMGRGWISQYRGEGVSPRYGDGGGCLCFCWRLTVERNYNGCYVDVIVAAVRAVSRLRRAALANILCFTTLSNINMLRKIKSLSSISFSERRKIRLESK